MRRTLDIYWRNFCALYILSSIVHRPGGMLCQVSFNMPHGDTIMVRIPVKRPREVASVGLYTATGVRKSPI